MAKIDVSKQVAEMEHTLRNERSRDAHDDALGILSRWQHDEMLDPDSRARARALVIEFSRNGESFIAVALRERGH